MSLPTLMGADETIGPALGNIAGAVQQIAQPYKRIELALKGALAENPGLAQKFADMEFMTPGSTQALFGPNAGRFFAASRPSNDAIIEKTVTPFIERTLKSPDIAEFVGVSRATGGKATPGGVEEDKYRGRIAAATAEAVEADPAVLRAAAIKKATGAGVGVYEEQNVRATTAQTAARIIATEKPDIILSKMLKGISGEEGGYTPSELNAIFSQPMSRALSLQLTAKLSDERNKLAERVAKMRADTDDSRRQDAVRRLLVHDALLQARNTGFSTPAGFLALSLGPESPLVQEFGGVTQEQLVQAQLAQETQSRQFREKGSIAALNGINSLMRTFLKAKANDAEPSELAGIVEAMRAAGTPYGFGVMYDEKNGLRVMRPDGSIIDPSTVVEKVSPVTGERRPNIETPPRPSSAGARGASTSSRSSISVAVPARKLSSSAQQALALLESMRAGKDPRQRTTIEGKFAEDLRVRAGKSKAARDVYDELKEQGFIK